MMLQLRQLLGPSSLTKHARPIVRRPTPFADQLAAMSKGAENMKLESEKKSEELGRKVTKQRRKSRDLGTCIAVANSPRRGIVARFCRLLPPAPRITCSPPSPPRTICRVRRASRVRHEHDGERSAQEDL